MRGSPLRPPYRGGAILVAMSKRTQPEADTWKTPHGVTLRAGETIVMVVRPSRALSLGKYLYTLGLYGIWRKRHIYVLTDDRLMTGKGVVNRTETSIPLNRVEEVAFVVAAWAPTARSWSWPTGAGGPYWWDRCWPRMPAASRGKSKPGPNRPWRPAPAPGWL